MAKVQLTDCLVGIATMNKNKGMLEFFQITKSLARVLPLHWKWVVAIILHVCPWLFSFHRDTHIASVSFSHYSSDIDTHGSDGSETEARNTASTTSVSAAFSWNCLMHSAPGAFLSQAWAFFNNLIIILFHVLYKDHNTPNHLGCSEHQLRRRDPRP